MKGFIKNLSRIFSKHNESKKPDYSTWTIEQRIDRVLHDVDFRNYCEACLEVSNFTLEKNLDMYERVARVALPPIRKAPQSEFVLSEGNLKHDICHFYLELDKTSPMTESAVNQVLKNIKYMIFEDKKGETRSYTGVYVPKKGKPPVRTIFINKNQSGIVAFRDGAHETGHSLSKNFTEMSRYTDEGMREVCTVIIDNLAYRYARTKYPRYLDEIMSDEEIYHATNVKKAQSALLETCVILVMSGEMSMSEARDKYADVFPRGLVEKTLTDIENGRFAAAYEGRYILPQAIAHGFMKTYDENPEQAITAFKKVLAHDTEYTVDQAIKVLGLPKKEVLIGNFADELPEKIAEVQDLREPEETESRNKN